MPNNPALANDQRLFLAKRIREFSRTQPELRELRRILLKLGGDELVPPSGADPITNFLIDFGIVFAGPAVVKHGPLARFWGRRAHGIVGIGTGYALHDDGLWREHSFGILREGVLEPLAPRLKYFGLLLIGQAADAFVETQTSRRRA